MVAHGFELADGVVSGFLGVEAGEVVAAGVVVGGVGGGDVPNRHQEGALYGDVGPQGSAAGSDAAVFGGQVGVAGVRDRHRRGAQCPLEVGVARAGAPRFDLAGGFVVARCRARPRCEVLGGRKFRHVGTGLGDHDVGGVSADAGDGADQVPEATNHTRHFLRDEMIAHRHDLSGSGSVGGHCFAGLAPARAVNPDADLGVLLGNVQARATRMNDVHGPTPFSS